MLLAFNKPYGVLSQFTDLDDRPTLASYVSIDHVYPAGRLDKDSEGLLLLTDDGKLQQRISHPNFHLVKRYWCQVEGVPDEQALARLRRGVSLKDGITRPAVVSLLGSKPKGLWRRQPSVRPRKGKPTAWLQLEISEGKNRQVRRMTAAVGLPTLRLIRCSIGKYNLADLQPGNFKAIELTDLLPWGSR